MPRSFWLIVFLTDRFSDHQIIFAPLLDHQKSRPGVPEDGFGCSIYWLEHAVCRKTQFVF